MIKRGEAINPTTLVVHLFFVKLSARKRPAWLLRGPLRRSTWTRAWTHSNCNMRDLSPTTTDRTSDLHDEDDFVRQGAAYRVPSNRGKHQYLAGFRPDPLFATRCLSCKLASPMAADLTLAKKAMRYLKEAREMSLFLALPDTMSRKLDRDAKDICGYSDAVWAGDPSTRKSVSCPLCFVDRFLPTSECKGQGAASLRARHSERHKPEAGRTRSSRQQHCSNSGRETGSCKTTLFLKLQNLTAVKTDDNPSDIGTKALGRQRFLRVARHAGNGRHARGNEPSSTLQEASLFRQKEWDRRWKMSAWTIAILVLVVVSSAVGFLESGSERVGQMSQASISRSRKNLQCKTTSENWELRGRCKCCGDALGRSILWGGRAALHAETSTDRHERFETADGLTTGKSR